MNDIQGKLGMKRLIIILLSIGNIHSFANCEVLTKGILSLDVRENLSIENISFTRNDDAKYGLKKKTKLIETEQFDSFGDKIVKTQERYELYKNGELLDSTPFVDTDTYSYYEFSLERKSEKYLELMLKKLALDC